MIPITGLSSNLALKVVDSTRQKQLGMIQKQPEHARAIEAFRERIGKVMTVDDLMKDYEVYSFVMKAFDLEDRIFARAMMGEILRSDLTDKKSLVNRLTDPRFREMNKEMGFTPGGKNNTQTLKRSWQEAMVNRYIETQFVNGKTAENPVVGAVLKFRRDAPDVKNWYDVLKDPTMGAFMRGALGIPDNVIRLDVDRQKAIFEKKFDITKINDPVEKKRLESNYMALTQARQGVFGGQSAPMATLLGSGGGLSGGAGIVTLDIAAIVATPISRYR